MLKLTDKAGSEELFRLDIPRKLNQIEFKPYTSGSEAHSPTEVERISAQVWSVPQFLRMGLRDMSELLSGLDDDSLRKLAYFVSGVCQYPSQRKNHDYLRFITALSEISCERFLKVDCWVKSKQFPVSE